MLAPGAVPAGYREVRYWKITGSFWLFLAINGLSVVALVVGGAFFLWFATRFGGLTSATQSGDWLLGLFAGILLTLALHELAHGLTMRWFGAHPRYGILWKALAAYATAPGHAFTRGHYLAVIVAPLASLSLLALVAMVVLAGTAWVLILALCAALNAAGAAGDLWMAGIVLRCPASAYIVDERDGLRVFLPDKDADPQSQVSNYQSPITSK
jgi:Putative zincin peptidase